MAAVNENKLKRLFPHASRDFIERNKNCIDDTRMSNKSKQMDRKEVCKAQRGKEMGAEYTLKHVDITFNALHGKQLDGDNREFTAKPILDALVNLEACDDDRNVTSKVFQEITKTQRLDKDNPNI